MCISPSFWPNAAGKIHQNGDEVFLRAGASRYALKAFNTGYCVGDCSLRVQPGDTLTGWLAYDEFELPLSAQAEGKTLEFQPKAYACR
jgi:hypothetical protein